MSLPPDKMQFIVFDYNKFFHPNVCHVCKWRGQSHLTSCLDCCMISYCNEKHRMLHRPQHQELCEAIRKMRKTRNFWVTRGMTKDEWIIHKKENVQTIKPIIRRELKPYEEQMFLFAKSCHICHQQHDLKITCSGCFSVNKCNDHKFYDIDHDCQQLKTSLFLDTDNYIHETSVSALQHHLHEKVANDKIELLIEQHKQRCAKTYLWKPDDYKYSDSVSSPLTLCYILLYNLWYIIHRREIVIHIIVQKLTDMQNLLAWEIVLHMLVPKIRLTIIMIGLELKNAEIDGWDLCEVCRASNKMLCFEIYSILYEHYTQSPFYVPPDIIIGLDADLQKFGANTIRTWRRQNVPLLLTTTSATKALDNIKKMNEVLGKCPDPCILTENEFRSHRPYRDLESDVFFSNSHLIFYDRLSFGLLKF